MIGTGRVKGRVELMDIIPPFSITVCGIEELDGHCATGVSHVLSILDPDRAVPEAFGSFGEHAKLELRFHDVIEADQDGKIAPDEGHVAALLAFGRDLLAGAAADAHLLVHCHVGISRSTAAMTLILAQALPEESAERVLAKVLSIREKTWPNLRMIEIGDAILGRRGTLVAAASGVYRSQLERFPKVADYMRSTGRQRELSAAGH